MKKQFGGKVADDLVECYSQSPHWKAGKFINQAATTMDFQWHVPGENEPRTFLGAHPNRLVGQNLTLPASSEHPGLRA